MPNQIRLGMLTPSSNTALEPITSAIVAEVNHASVHFSRFRVTEISLSEQALDQFQDTKLLEAAQLLADAKVDVIAWNGTSAGWLGFDRDLQLCEAIQSATGIPATTSVLALNEIFQQQQITRFGLVTPYLATVQAQIMENYQKAGFDCVAERHLDRQVNFSFAEVAAAELEQMILAVAEAQPQAITTFCTNLQAAPLVDRLEQKIQIPIYDTIAVVIWKALKMVGVDTSQITKWGRLFREL